MAIWNLKRVTISSILCYLMTMWAVSFCRDLRRMAWLWILMPWFGSWCILVKDKPDMNFLWALYGSTEEVKIILWFICYACVCSFIILWFPPDCKVTCFLANFKFSPIDPDHPFIKSDNMETIFITASDTHIEVPCLVSDPELKVSLFSVGMPPSCRD